MYFKEGESLGLIRGHVANGLFESQEQIDNLNAGAPSGLYQSSLTSPGDVYYADLDGDGEVSSSASGLMLQILVALNLIFLEVLIPT
ncbi:hypothetical protein JCM19274_2230 [Algibacter lectus]|uniref:Uncharacterized protein n=1 Tax=Algibacter lectus TaxID=221126 RepID=A0A090WVQ8_9FLAO|nr:hypothetical protein [Algibacter lectus]GAL81056.1 hypothetical protein JCM19274_2230 [Algibacter lectus]